MTFFSIIILAAIVWAVYKFKPLKYRISMIDPVTGRVKYLIDIDGISNKFEYTAEPDRALIFRDAARAERFAKEIDKKNTPTVEKKRFVWTKMNNG